jgi:hypothetical protein
LATLETLLDNSSEEVVEGLDEMLEQAGADELGYAMSRGVVHLHGLGVERASENDFMDVVISGISDLLADSVGAGARTFPLFDDDAGGLVRAMVAEGKVSVQNPARSAEAGTAGRLIGGLQAFPNATMEDLLDVREALTGPRVRFRSALSGLTAEFENASWDEDFDREVADLYRRSVAPALLEIEETLDALGARATLLRLASHERLIPAATTLGLAAAAAVGYADLPAAVYSAPVAPALAAGAKEALRRTEIAATAASNSFYFLHAANQDLQ